MDAVVTECITDLKPVLLALARRHGPFVLLGALLLIVGGMLRDLRTRQGRDMAEAAYGKIGRMMRLS